MKCPFCNATEDKVIDSRASKDGGEIRRRRECVGCARRFTTYERVEEAMPQVIKSDGRRQPFDRQKILRGLRFACSKLAVPMEKLDSLALAVEKEVSELGVKEVPAKEIGQMVLPRLRALHEVAYVRFASIYRSFRDIDEFLLELSDIVKTRTGDTRPS